MISVNHQKKKKNKREENIFKKEFATLTLGNVFQYSKL